MRLTIIGMGLIGGSVARALAARDAGAWHVTAWSRTPDGPQAALADGVVDAVAPSADAAVADADLVLLAAGPLDNLQLLRRLGLVLASTVTTVTDVTSAQVRLAAEAASSPGLRYVGGHPMAGIEARGYQAARADLFVDRPWVVLPPSGAAARDVELVESLAIACGARPLRLEPGAHDHLVAAISHLPFVVATALAEAVTTDPAWPDAALLAAGGWRDTTRVARGDPDLGAGIAALNRDELLAWLDRFAAALSSLRAEIAALSDVPDAAGVSALRDRLARVREALLGDPS